MNLAEKLASTYLRLNGFLLLPEFTIFNGRQHNHVDLVGLRAANSIEVADKPDGGDYELPLDEQLFQIIADNVTGTPKEKYLGVVAQVKTNDEDMAPRQAHVNYVRDFLGGTPVVPISFFETYTRPEWRDDCLRIGHEYILGWIRFRADSMDAELRLTKTNSWTWSEEFLGELLALRKLGF